MSNKDIYHCITDFIDMNAEYISGVGYIRIGWLLEEIKELLNL